MYLLSMYVYLYLVSIDYISMPIIIYVVVEIIIM